MRPCGGNERFDPARERDGFRNLLDERQIPQGRRHLRQDAKEVISRNQVQSARTDSAVKCNQHGQIPQSRAATCV